MDVDDPGTIVDWSPWKLCFDHLSVTGMSTRSAYQRSIERWELCGRCDCLDRDDDAMHVMMLVQWVMDLHED
jgi:hypothetical protein